MEEKIKILIIEDDPFFRKICTKFLEDEGFFVLVAVNGIEGLEKFKTEKPDLVILDLILPEKHGLEVLEEMRRNPDPKLANTPVVVLTNVFRAFEEERCKELKADFYFVKAHVSPEEVVIKIREILSKRTSKE